MGRLTSKLDLHDISNRDQHIDRALHAITDEALAKKAPLVEIIPGKSSGQLNKRVLRFLDRNDIKPLSTTASRRTPTTSAGSSSTSAGSDPHPNPQRGTRLAR